MKQKIGRIVKIICFCLVAVLMVNALEGLFKPKWLENRWASSKTNKSFYELEKTVQKFYSLEQALLLQQQIRISYMKITVFLHII